MWKTIKRKSQRIGFPLRQRSVAVSSSTTKSFHYLNYLGDDLILEILSFTSCGPLEMSPGKKNCSSWMDSFKAYSITLYL